MSADDTAQRATGIQLFELAVIAPTLVGGAILLLRDPTALDPTLAVWVAIVAVVELVPVPLWRGLHMSMTFPVLLVVGILNPPVAAGLTALLGSFDPREFKGEVGLLRALFNRSQIALSVFAASLVFHAIADIQSPTVLLFIAAILAAIADYAVNTTLVALGGS